MLSWILEFIDKRWACLKVFAEIILDTISPELDVLVRVLQVFNINIQKVESVNS